MLIAFCFVYHFVIKLTRMETSGTLTHPMEVGHLTEINLVLINAIFNVCQTPLFERQFESFLVTVSL